METDSSRPVPSGLLTLLDSTNSVIDRGWSEDDGSFTLRAHEAGTYSIRASVLGYGSENVGGIELTLGQETTIRYFVTPNPLELEGLSAVVEQDYPALAERKYLTGQGFFDREERGFGHFFTPEDLEKRPPFVWRDLMQRVPFAQVRGVGGFESVTFHSRGTPCRPAIWVDGIRQGIGLQGLSTMDAAAVEVYTRSTVLPIEYSGFSSCAILIWTKR